MQTTPTSFADPAPIAVERPPALPGAKAFLADLFVTALTSVLGGTIGLFAGFFVTGYPTFGVLQGLGGGVLAGIAIVAALTVIRAWRVPSGSRYAGSPTEETLAERAPGSALLFACVAGILLATAIGGGIGLAAGCIVGELSADRSDVGIERHLRATNAGYPDAIYWVNCLGGTGSGLASGCGAGLALVGLLLWRRSR